MLKEKLFFKIKKMIWYDLHLNFLFSRLSERIELSERELKEKKDLSGKPPSEPLELEGYVLLAKVF